MLNSLFMDWQYLGPGRPGCQASSMAPRRTPACTVPSTLPAPGRSPRGAPRHAGVT